MVNFLWIIHYEERLCDNFISVIVLNIFTIGLEGYQLASGQLVDLLLGDFIRLWDMELELIYLLWASLGLSIVDFLAVAADEVPADHLVGFTDETELIVIEWSLHDAVIELDDHRVVLRATQSLGNQLSVLNLIVIEAARVLLEISLIMVSYLSAMRVVRGQEAEMAAEHEDCLFVDIRINITGWLIELKPRIRLETHQAYLFSSFYQEHDIAISLLAFFKQPLLDHLRVVNEANELPFT